MGETDNMQSLRPFILKNLTGVKLCQTDAVTEGCSLDTHPVNTQWLNNKGGVILSNGASIVVDDRGDGSMVFIDWNGNRPPNTVALANSDTVCLFANGGSETWVSGGFSGGPAWTKPGTVESWKNGYLLTYNDIYQQ
jgi:hypothetical protein